MNAAKAFEAVVSWTQAFSQWAKVNKRNATVCAVIGLLLGLAVG